MTEIYATGHQATEINMNDRMSATETMQLNENMGKTILPVRQALTTC